MSAIVREARADERSLFLPLVLEGWAQYAEMLGVEEWKVMQSSLVSSESMVEQARIFYAEIDGRPVGCVAYCPPGGSDGLIFPREWASIRLLTIIPSARGLGLGRALMERCVEAARADGAATLGLHTEERMTVARGLYARMGFRHDADLPAKYGAPRWRFALHLKNAVEESAPIGSRTKAQ